MVGEKGPELIRMGSTSGHVTPNHRLGGGNAWNAAPNASAVDVGRAVRDALNGMTVVIDGRRIGEVQASAADRYARGG